MRFLYVVLFLIVIKKPQLGQTQQISETQKTSDIVFLVDISKSMNAQDVKPSRLEKAKEIMLEIIQTYPQDSKALVVFASETFVLTPLTNDNSLLQTFIRALNTQMVSGGSTDLFAGLDLAVKKLRLDSFQNLNSKNIVLFTDGEDFSEQKSSLKQLVREKNMQVSVFGLGSEEGAQIPEGNALKLDDDAKPVLTKTNLIFLREVFGKESCFELSPQKNELPLFYQTFARNKTRILRTAFEQTLDFTYLFFLIPAFFLVMVDLTYLTFKFKSPQNV